MRAAVYRLNNFERTYLFKFQKHSNKSTEWDRGWSKEMRTAFTMINRSHNDKYD